MRLLPRLPAEGARPTSAASRKAFFYRHPAVLERDTHKPRRIQPAGHRFARQSPPVPLVAAEFAQAIWDAKGEPTEFSNPLMKVLAWVKSGACALVPTHMLSLRNLVVLLEGCRANGPAVTTTSPKT